VIQGVSAPKCGGKSGAQSFEGNSCLRPIIALFEAFLSQMCCGYGAAFGISGRNPNESRHSHGNILRTLRRL
jgi:hypothetical protein